MVKIIRKWVIVKRLFNSFLIPPRINNTFTFKGTRKGMNFVREIFRVNCVEYLTAKRNGQAAVIHFDSHLMLLQNAFDLFESFFEIRIIVEKFDVCHD
jgi:hypothetical protein